jgi:serine/threonine protein phosphatase PrpC
LTIGEYFDTSCDYKYPRIRDRTVVAKRRNKHGEERGPDVLFGQYEMSINMTRSLGDRYGPRSCVALPDVTTMMIEGKRRARIVLGSDGLWDALSVEDVQALVFSSPCPSAVAELLSSGAVIERKNRGKRNDDVSVIVVDINVERNNGGCCAVC